MQTEPPPCCSGAQQSDQQEQQLTGVHVAEQSHAQRNCFRHELDQVQAKVRKPQRRVRAKGRTKQLMDKTADAFDLDVVVEHEAQHADRHAKRAVQVGGRHDAEVGLNIK